MAQEELVIINKSDLTSIADVIREATDTTELLSLSEIHEGMQTIASQGGGLTPATLTIQDIDEKCTLYYVNTSGELITVTKPAYNSTYEIGVPSIVGAFGSAGGGYHGSMGGGSPSSSTLLFSNTNHAVIYAYGDCGIFFLGK